MTAARRLTLMEERFPVEVGPDVTGLLVVRHEHTGHVEHVPLSARHPPPRAVFEADRDPVSKRWTVYGTRRGWLVERWGLERWIAA